MEVEVACVRLLADVQDSGFACHDGGRPRPQEAEEPDEGTVLEEELDNVASALLGDERLVHVRHDDIGNDEDAT